MKYLEYKKTDLVVRARTPLMNSIDEEHNHFTFDDNNIYDYNLTLYKYISESEVGHNLGQIESFIEDSEYIYFTTNLGTGGSFFKYNKNTGKASDLGTYEYIFKLNNNIYLFNTRNSYVYLYDKNDDSITNTNIENPYGLFNAQLDSCFINDNNLYINTETRSLSSKVYYFNGSEFIRENKGTFPLGNIWVSYGNSNRNINCYKDRERTQLINSYTFDSIELLNIKNNVLALIATYEGIFGLYIILGDGEIYTLKDFDYTVFSDMDILIKNLSSKVFLYGFKVNVYEVTLNEYVPPGDGTGGMIPTNPDTEGGDGNFDNTSDNISYPSLPVVDASAVGMLALYNPTGGELQQFADFLWSPNFYQSIQRFFSDTADAVINLGIVPFGFQGPMEKKDVSICALRSGVKMNVINSQYVEIDLGKIKIEKYFGSFLDYAPYTNIQIYIPFVGYQTLNTDEVMGNEIHLHYDIDVATGNFTCYLLIAREDVFYIGNIFTGNMMSKYCISSRSFDQFISASINVAGTIASAGLGALAATSTTTAATSTATKAAKAASVSNSTALATQGTRALSTNVHIPLNNFTPPEPTDPPVPNIDNMIVKPPIVRTGSLSGSDPLFAPKEAFIIINRPNPAIADKFSSFYGFRANYTETLSNLSGFTKVSAVNLKGFESATLEEKQTIKDQLISGIIL